MALKRRIGWILGVSVSLALAGACSLNPQPIPPGDTNYSDASPTNAAKGDGGGTSGGSGTDGGDGSFTNDDAGDAGDSGEDLDAATDASDSGDM